MPVLAVEGPFVEQHFDGAAADEHPCREGQRQRVHVAHRQTMDLGAHHGVMRSLAGAGADMSTNRCRRRTIRARRKILHVFGDRENFPVPGGQVTTLE